MKQDVSLSAQRAFACAPPGAGNPNFGDAPIQENFPELPRGQTRDLAAQVAGFGNGKTYEQAKSVVDHGVPETVARMEKERGLV